jgi:hypothetical protein
MYQSSAHQADYNSATTMPATPSTPGSAVAKAPESVTLLATELAAEPAAEVALPATPLREEEELPLAEDELPLLEPEELEPEELDEPLVLEALEPEEVPELLPPVMLLRTEPGGLSVWFLVVVEELVGNLTWGCGGAGDDGAL